MGISKVNFNTIITIVNLFTPISKISFHIININIISLYFCVCMNSPVSGLHLQHTSLLTIYVIKCSKATCNT